MFAQATILGNLGRNPDIKIVGQNNKVASFSIAVNEKKQGGQETTHWFYVNAWGQLADLCEKYVVKGSRILVSGRLNTRSYVDKDNITRNVVEIVADKIELVSTPQGQQGTATAPVAAASTAAPAQASAPAHGAAYRPGQDDPLPPLTTDDDNDLPF